MDRENGLVWEMRWHPLREEWVFIAAHRQDRPWSGDRVRGKEKELPEYDPECYLCPDNVRVSGARNPDYADTFVFDNDHPSVGLHAPEVVPPPSTIFRNRPALGIARVVCYTPKHNTTLAEMDRNGIVQLLKTWQRQYRELGSHPEIAGIMMFENKGEVVGVSNPHPHCQIYATSVVTKFIEVEERASLAYWRENRRALFQDILKAEAADGRRIIAQNDSAVAFLPYFARYAYETYVAPKETYPSIAEMSAGELVDFADVLRSVLVRFDNLWEMSFPYVMALHQAPVDGGDYGHFHFHIELYPPLRKPNLLKYHAGIELGGGNFLSDTSPEEKAAELRALPGVHYKLAGAGSQTGD